VSCLENNVSARLGARFFNPQTWFEFWGARNLMLLFVETVKKLHGLDVIKHDSSFEELKTSGNFLCPFYRSPTWFRAKLVQENDSFAWWWKIKTMRFDIGHLQIQTIWLHPSNFPT
jgi:hypothetical protein